MADWTLLREVVEIESGKRADRPKLEEALALCRVHSAKLIIAKLDSLARNVAFVSNLLKEGAHELHGVDRADPPDHPKGQVFFDAFGRCRCGGAQEPGLELLAMGAVVDPFPVAVIHSPAAMVAEWPTTVTKFPVSPRLGPKDAEAVLRIVEGDALDEAREDLDWRACPWRLRHYVMMEITFPGRYRDQAGKVCFMFMNSSA